MRPNISATKLESEVSFTITIDSLGKDIRGDYEMRISFHSPEDEDY